MSVNQSTAKELFEALVELGFKVKDTWLYAGEIRVTIAGNDFCVFQSSKYQGWTFVPWNHTSYEEWIDSGLPISACTDEVLNWVIPLLIALPGCPLTITRTLFKPRVIYPAGEQQELCL